MAYITSFLLIFFFFYKMKKKKTHLGSKTVLRPKPALRSASAGPGLGQSKTEVGNLIPITKIKSNY